MRFVRWLYATRLKLRILFRRSQVERELDEEMQFHLEQRIEQEVANGASPSEARRVARRSMDGIAQQKEDCRDVWGTRFVDQLGQDLRYAIRGFFRERQFTIAVVTTIMVSLGASTAIFSVVDQSLLRPLPYAQGDRLVSVGMVIPLWGPDDYMFVGAYRDWRDGQNAVMLTSWSGVQACDFSDNSPQRLNCASVESTFLPTLGVNPLLGRHFTVEDDTPGAAPVALLSHSMWRTTFGADPNVVDEQILLDGKTVRIVGVLPSNFEMPDLVAADIVVPQQLPVRGRNRPANVIGRLSPGTSRDGAAAALSPLFDTFRTDFGSRAGSNFEEGMVLRVASLRDAQVEQYRLALWMFCGAALAFVLIACANIANLQLARSAGRTREFALRSAIGGSPARVARQLLTEGLLLGVVGGVLGCSLAYGLLKLVVSAASGSIPRLSQAHLDLRVLGVATALSLGAALVLGLTPSLGRTRAEALGAISAAARRRGTGLRQALITAQLAISLVLLTGAGLLVMSMMQMQDTQLGFSTERIVTATVTLPVHRYSDAASQVSFFSRLEERLEEIPGAAAVSIADTIPPGEAARSSPYANFVDPARQESSSDMQDRVVWRYVSHDYFKTLGIPVRWGRDDSLTSDGIVVSKSLSGRIFNDRDPLGQLVGTKRIIGIAGDVRNFGLSAPSLPEFYVIRGQSHNGVPSSGNSEWWRHATAVVRTTLSEQIAADQLRAAFQDIDSSIPVQLGTMESEVDRFLARPRFDSTLLTGFALAGLAMAAIGLYGLVAYVVAARTSEIGVRMALGATTRAIRQFIIADAIRCAFAGTLLGIGASTLLLPIFGGLFGEVGALDPRVFGGAAIVLLLAVTLAAWLPARAACRVSPTTALRHE